MPSPKLSQAEIDALVEKGVPFLRSQRDFYYPQALQLSADRRTIFEPFFAQEILDQARVAVLEHGARPSTPVSVEQLKNRGFSYIPDISHLNVCCFVDVLVTHLNASHRFVFHGLVNMAQTRLLGVERYAEIYVRGLFRTAMHVLIPTEAHAYELDHRFALAPDTPFSVEDEIKRWIAEGRYSLSTE